jgi:hypothetical protein
LLAGQQFVVDSGEQQRREQAELRDAIAEAARVALDQAEQTQAAQRVGGIL